MDALERAKAIAARLSMTTSSPSVSELGKRKGRWPGDGDGEGHGGRKKKIYIPVDEYPDINFMGLLIGPRGSNQRRMEELSGAKILIRGRGSQKEPSGEEEDNEDLHVLITADDDEQIATAQKEVEKILFNPEEAMHLKREQLRKVAELNGTLRDGEGGGGHYGPSETEANTVELMVPATMVGYIIGKGGETIKDLQFRSGARIQINRDLEGKGGPERAVTICGSEEVVEKAKSLIKGLVDDKQRGGYGSGRDGGHYGPGGGSQPADSIKLPIPEDKVGLIIGRGGMTIKGIQQRTGANIQIPSQPGYHGGDPNTRLVDITGSSDAVTAAQCEIESLLVGQQQQQSGQGQQDPSALTLQIPNDKVGLVIGRGGETIKGIQNRSGARVQIPGESDSSGIRTVVISGPPEAQASAKYEIDGILSQEPSGGGGGGGYDRRGSGGRHNRYDSHYSEGQYSESAYTYDAGAQVGGYDQQQYQQQYSGGEYYQQQQGAADGSASADPNDPNSYWNGYNEYAAYYGIEAANAAWGVSADGSAVVPQGTSAAPGT